MGKRGLSISCPNCIIFCFVFVVRFIQGGLSISVEGPSKAEIKCEEKQDGTCAVNYLPLEPGQYNISIKFSDKHIPGSPFLAKITGNLYLSNLWKLFKFWLWLMILLIHHLGDQVKRSQFEMGAVNNIALEIDNEDIKNLRATVRNSSGIEEPCFLKSLPDNRLGKIF